MLLITVYAADGVLAPEKLDFPRAGFRISPLDLPPPLTQDSTTQFIPPLQMYLHLGKIGPAPSVEVTIHPVANGLADFITHYKEMFIRKDATILSEKNPSATESVIEYTSGSIGGLKLHFYRRAILANSKIFLASASARDEEWPGCVAGLKTCVDSLEATQNLPATNTKPIAVVASAATPNIALPAKLDFPNCGFRINALEDPTNVGTGQPVLFMKLALANGLEASVFIDIQPFDKTMSDFAAGTKAGIAHSAGFAFISEKSPSANVWVNEYTTDRQGTKGHYYIRSILAGGKIYRAVGASLDDKHWPEFGDYGAKLKACVDSLELSPTPAVTAK